MTSALYGAELSHVHHVGFGDFSRRAAPGLIDRLRSAWIHDGRVLDVGCGGGDLTRLLLDAGYAVTAIDISPAMIEIARRSAPEADFIVGSVATIELPRCDAAVAVGEVLGYESEDAVDLPAAFARFADAIRPGGMLIFDLLMQSGGSLMNHSGSHEGEGWRVDVETREDRERSVVTRRIHTEIRDREEVRRSDELHRVRTFDVLQVIRWLEAAGFQVETGSAYGDQPMLERRLAFFARRLVPDANRPSP